MTEYKTKQQVHNRAKEAVGKTLMELNDGIPISGTKSSAGDAFETWFGKQKDSDSRPDMEEAEITKTAENLKKVLEEQKAKMLEEKAMGPRELAYEIKKFKTGYYYLFVVEATPEAVAEFDRVVRINESLLRHLIVKVED